jgi:hypothetical protein
MKSFRAQIEENKKTIKDMVRFSTQELAKSFLKMIFDSSPIYSGQYINSHILSVGESVGRFRGQLYPAVWDGVNYTPMPQQMQMEARKKTHERERDKVRKIKPFDVVHIQNNAPHAEVVEYVGWTRMDAWGLPVAGTQAYYVYESAEHKLESFNTKKCIRRGILRAVKGAKK